MANSNASEQKELIKKISPLLGTMNIETLRDLLTVLESTVTQPSIPVRKPAEVPERFQSARSLGFVQPQPQAAQLTAGGLIPRTLADIGQALTNPIERLLAPILAQQRPETLVAEPVISRQESLLDRIGSALFGPSQQTMETLESPVERQQAMRAIAKILETQTGQDITPDVLEQEVQRLKTPSQGSLLAQTFRVGNKNVRVLPSGEIKIV